MNYMENDWYDLSELLNEVYKEASGYHKMLDHLPAHEGELEKIIESFDGKLPEEGIGALAAIKKLIGDGRAGLIHSTGDNCYHFVTGGVTPAALACEWYSALVDQPSFAWSSSPLGVRLEMLAVDWLKDLFDLPDHWKGIMVTGATMANYTCLMAARQWCGEQHGLDISEVGLRNAPEISVVSSGYIHASSKKCLSMVGMGRSALKIFSKDNSGTLDKNKLENYLKAIDGSPAIIIGNAGEVNTGAFDDIVFLAEMAAEYNCWLHVDGAFGLFARVSPKTRYLASGVEKAHSVTVDGHKWLNVPYDSGYAFVSDPGLLVRAFHYAGDYLPDPYDEKPNFGSLGPESSRKARAIPVWATLMAYGREGYQKIVENCVENAQYMAQLIGGLDQFELLAEVPLNIVCFRLYSGGKTPEELNHINTRLAELIFEDGRVYAGPTQYKGMTALRPAIVNWRISKSSIDRFVDVVDELSRGLL